jgi:UDP-3-O-[3-hydroxymyristoyl] glucosamine N-acyltransferase
MSRNQKYDLTYSNCAVLQYVYTRSRIIMATVTTLFHKAQNTLTANDSHTGAKIVNNARINKSCHIGPKIP